MEKVLTILLLAFFASMTSNASDRLGVGPPVLAVNGVVSGITDRTTACSSAYSIQAPSSAAAGARINVRFTYPGAKPTSQSDWIGLFPVGSNTYREWYWVKDLPDCAASFGGAPVGNFEFRYLLEGSYDKVAARSVITIK